MIWVPSPTWVGPACRAGLRGHAATSEECRSKGRPRGDVERRCDPWRFFALRRKSFPAERTYLNSHPRLLPDDFIFGHFVRKLNPDVFGIGDPCIP